MTKFNKSLKKFLPLLTEFVSKISQNEQLFQELKVYDEKDHYTLNEEQKMLLEETYKGFVRNGALLNDEKKEQLKILILSFLKIFAIRTKCFGSDQSIL